MVEAYGVVDLSVPMKGGCAVRIRLMCLGTEPTVIMLPTNLAVHLVPLAPLVINNISGWPHVPNMLPQAACLD